MSKDLPNSPLIAVLDYQAGNLRSVQKALEICGATAIISADPSVIAQSDAVVFPGQGACDSSMRNLRTTGLDKVIVSIIRKGTPFLGVCLGLQLLLEESDEGNEPGLGIIKGKVERLSGGLKVPHMGWNKVNLRPGHPIFDGIEQDSHFYFVHSYVAVPRDEEVVAGTTWYGREFCSAVAFDNITAVQFHPEQSGDIGLKIYSNFVRYVGLTDSK